MTLSSFLNPSYGFEKPSINERGDHVHYHTSWKGGGLKGGQISQSAISALTLLAFLFFLNILQTCLKDQLQGQSPLVIMMTTQTTTTTTEAQRHKRSARVTEKEDGGREKGDIQEENKRTKEIDLSSKAINQLKIRNGTSFKIENNRSKQILTSFGAPEHLISPWLQSVVCCKILTCKKLSKEKTAHYSSYFRRLINYLCYSTNAAKQNSCTMCFTSPQDFIDLSE